MNEKKILIACLGNRLRKDDGLGSYVAERLLRIPLPSNVTVIDYGTAGFKLFHDLMDYDIVIFVDVIHGSGEAGSVVRFEVSERDIKDVSPQDSSELFYLSYHEIDIESVLALSKNIGKLPSKVIVIGMIPEDTGQGLGLSKSVAKNFMKLVNMILEEIRRIIGED